MSLPIPEYDHTVNTRPGWIAIWLLIALALVVAINAGCSPYILDERGNCHGRDGRFVKRELCG